MNKIIHSRIGLYLLLVLVMGVPGLANADLREFKARLSGEQQVPEEVSTGRGSAEVRFNPAFRYLLVEVTIRDLVGNVTAAHFHCARAGENGPVVFGLVAPGPLALDGNNIKGRLTNADYTGADCVGPVGRTINNIASLAFAMREGLIYLNIHTDAIGSGEVRGQLVEKDDDLTPTAAGN